MAITLTTTPTYALPSDAVPVTATVNTSANYVRLWCTDAPDGSIYKQRLINENADRIEITPPTTYVGDALSVGVPVQMQLDRGGRYTFVGQEYTLGASTYGGGYSNAAAAYKSETKVGSEQTLHIYIGQRMTHRLGASNYGLCSLLVYVWNDTIRETTVAIHGVDSPAIIAPTTPRASSAASASGVLTQLALFKDAAVSTLSPNLATLVAEMKIDLPQHFNNRGPTGAVNYHQDTPSGNRPDTDNDSAIENIASRVGTPEAAVHAAQVLSGRLRLHMSNGPDGSYHYHDKQPDYEHALIVDSPGSVADLSTAFAAIADVYRAYEAHRVDTTSHAIADTYNVLTTVLGPLLSLHKEFLSAMLTLSPTASGGQQTATVQLNARGFRLE